MYGSSAVGKNCAGSPVRESAPLQEEQAKVPEMRLPVA